MRDVCARAFTINRARASNPPRVSDFLNAFFGEMMTIFSDEYVFLGGDEVDHTCWDANPAIAAWLTAHNMTSAQLEQYFWRQMTERVLPVSLAGRTVAIWEADAMQIDPKMLPAGTVADNVRAPHMLVADCDELLTWFNAKLRTVVWPKGATNARGPNKKDTDWAIFFYKPYCP